MYIYNNSAISVEKVVKKFATKNLIDIHIYTQPYYNAIISIKIMENQVTKPLKVRQ